MNRTLAIAVAAVAVLLAGSFAAYFLLKPGQPVASVTKTPTPGPSATALMVNGTPYGGDANKPGTTAYIESHVFKFSLGMTGAVSGTWTRAQIVRCGTVGSTWRLQALDPDAVGGKRIGLAFGVSGYSAPGTFSAPTANGSLSDQATKPITVYPLQSGSMTINPDGQSGSIQGVFSDGSSRVTVSGAFSCTEPAT